MIKKNQSNDISSIITADSNAEYASLFSNLNVSIFCYFLSCDSLVLIYHILFGFHGFTLNVNTSDCLIIY